MALHHPLLVGDVEGHKVRYFLSPVFLHTGKPDLPWHAVDDLWAIFMPDRETFDGVKRRLRSDWNAPKTVATPEGIVTIAPHFMAEGIIHAVGQLECRPKNFLRLRGRYRYFCTQALKTMTSHMSGARKMAFALAALGD